jgi:hypothetical protein
MGNRKAMPKVTITNDRGLVQSTGNGVEIASNLTVSGTTALAGNIALSGNTTLTGALLTSVNTLTGAGAVSLTTTTTVLDTTGANALTLASGATGQIKVITMRARVGDATLTPTALEGGTTLTFNSIGDTVALVYNGTKWAIISNNGATLA